MRLTLKSLALCPRPFTAGGGLAEARLVFSLSGAEPDCPQGLLPELWPRLLLTFHINVARWPAYENVCQDSVKRVSLARILLLVWHAAGLTVPTSSPLA